MAEQEKIHKVLVFKAYCSLIVHSLHLKLALPISGYVSKFSFLLEDTTFLI